MVNLIEPNTSPKWAVEFPDFPAADMPPIPAGFADASWHNEACPGFMSDRLGLQIWVDYADSAQREFPGTARFGVVGLTFHGEHGWQIDDRNREFYHGDDWRAAMLAVLVNSDHGRRQRAAVMAGLTQELANVVGRMSQAYEASKCGRHSELALNDEQPRGFQEVIAGSLDEWAMCCHEVIRQWQESADVTRAPGYDQHTGGNVWARRYDLAGDFFIYGPPLDGDHSNGAGDGFEVYRTTTEGEDFPACDPWPEHFKADYPTFEAAAAAVAAFLSPAVRS